jgi:hypothetical protein
VGATLAYSLEATRFVCLDGGHHGSGQGDRGRNITSSMFLARRRTAFVQGRDPARDDSHDTTCLFEEEKGERVEEGKKEKGEREGG